MRFDHPTHEPPARGGGGNFGIVTAFDYQSHAVGPLYVGPVEDAERVAAPLRQVGQPIADAVQPMPYAALQTTLDAALPQGIRALEQFELSAAAG